MHKAMVSDSFCVATFKQISESGPLTEESFLIASFVVVVNFLKDFRLE